MATVAKPSAKQRLFAGARLRGIRQRAGLNQAAMAAQMAISPSYLSQLENDERPLTTALLAALSRNFAFDLTEFEGLADSEAMVRFQSALDDPLFGRDRIDPEQSAKWLAAQPELSGRLTQLHAAYREGEERLHIVDDVFAGQAGATRLPWEEVRDWFHDSGNYIDLIDRKAEAVAAEIGVRGREAMRQRLDAVHGITVRHVERGEAMIRFDKDARTLLLDPALPAETRHFQFAHRLALEEFRDDIATIAASADLRTEEARRLVTLGLANYAAGALVMPYQAYRAAAQKVRHDVDQLCHLFQVSFEQACHRLSTLQRPGLRGVPFYFCRVDMAGNITKRHSATRLQFARFGGACPLWVMHEAVAIPGRIFVQLAETPDAVRYVSIAKGLVKQSGSFGRAPRRYAVALGCEAQHARAFVYADGLNLASPEAATRIGMGCRTCPRNDCDQRAFPPTDRHFQVDPDRRDQVPYTIL